MRETNITSSSIPVQSTKCIVVYSVVLCVVVWCVSDGAGAGSHTTPAQHWEALKVPNSN